MSGEPNQVVWRGVQPVAGIRGIWPAIDSARINLGGYVPASTLLNLYTVPAGKTLFIFSAYLTTKLGSTTNTYAWILTRDAAAAAYVYLITQYYHVSGNQTNAIHFKPAIELPEGYDVILQTGAGTLEARGGVFGWLEDA